jgi:hypothetical protein
MLEPNCRMYRFALSVNLTEKKHQKLLPLTHFHFLRIKNSAYEITMLCSSICVPLISSLETVEGYSRNLV